MSFLAAISPGPTCPKCGKAAAYHFDRFDEKHPYLMRVHCLCGFEWTKPTLDAPAAFEEMERHLVHTIDGYTKLPVGEFQGFKKIPRLRRLAYITEKIDGTNAHVHILDDGRVLAASKNRYVTPAEDNYGFAKWVEAHANLLYELLGPGRHYGEWWGQGINRGYGLAEKRFSLFNVERWRNVERDSGGVVRVVPTLGISDSFTTDMVDEALLILRLGGSYAAPGFMRPEGVVVYHTAANAYFKQTIEGDEKPKGAA